MKSPDFCKNSSVLVVVSYTQILITALYCFSDGPHSFELIGYMSIYGQWLSLMLITLLCITRDWVNALSIKLRTLTICFFYTSSFWVVELTFKYLSSLYIQPQHHYADSLFRYMACSIIFFLVFRVIDLLDTIERRSKSEANARIAALQSRIKPHFLFNSLNTIAELTTNNAKHAEQAINSLAKLFRVALSTDSKQHSLENELNLCHQYESLERWRFSERLEISWFVDIKDTNQISVPKLLLQPLLENSITHGIESDGTINISIDIRETNSHLSIKINNGFDPHRIHRGGNGLAIENTKERLFVIYDDNHKFKINHNNETFNVIIQIPKNINND